MPNQNAAYYNQNLKRPSWAPPSWLFGPVWTVLYVLIIVSFGAVFIAGIHSALAFSVVLPFILNIIFNVIYTPIQFRLKSNYLALLDVVLVWLTLVWALYVIYPHYHWITFINIPYVAWVSFASVLQARITWLNS